MLIAALSHPSASPKVILVVVAGFVILFLAAKGGVFNGVGGGGEGGRVQGTGRMYRCQRCGRDFQPEKVELVGNGNVHHFIDDRCPGCGWDKDRPDPDRKRPGGAGGGW